MPVLSNFPGGSSSGGGFALDAVSGIATQVASGKVYIKWTDPEDMIADEIALATWSGTLLVRKAGSMPSGRRDGTVILDSKLHNAYKDTYFCDSGLTDGETYYYKFFPYTTTKTYTDSGENEFSATPSAHVTGIDDWVVTNMSASTEAGNGKMEIMWTDPAATIVSDDVTLATWGGTTVVVKEGGYPTSKDDADAVYTLKTITYNQFSTSALTVDGLTNGVTYYVGFFPETTDGYVNTSDSQRTTGAANLFTIDADPVQSGTLTYTGNPLTPAWNNFNPEQLVIEGTTTGTNAGEYMAVFTPTEDYQWSDGTVSSRNIAWAIEKAECVLNLSTTSVTLGSDAINTTVSITYIGDGMITAVSNDTSIATIVVDGTAIVISSVNGTSGSTTITVSASEGVNYKAPASQTISVNAAFGVVASVAPRDGVTYRDGISNLDLETINLISEAISKNSAITNATSTVYIDYDDLHRTVSIGHGFLTKHPYLSGDILLTIIGFNHDDLTDDAAYGSKTTTGKAGMTLMSTLFGGYNMNPTATNSGGWKNSDMRTSVIATFGDSMPSDWKSIMKPVDKKSGLGGGSSNGTEVTSDKYFLLSEVEVFGSTTWSVPGEGSQYAYYKAGNSKVKTWSNEPINWWLRSPMAGNVDAFCLVDPNGSAGRYYATTSLYYYLTICV